MKIKNYPPTQSKFQVFYNDIIPKDEIEYIKDLRIACVLECYMSSSEDSPLLSYVAICCLP